MKILIVDDDATNRTLYKILLQQAGYEIIEAENGEEAIDLAMQEIPDLILMDIQMPVLDGISALKVIRANENTKDIPVIAVTSYAMYGDRDKFLSEGFNDYIPKPLNIDGFVKKITLHINVLDDK